MNYVQGYVKSNIYQRHISACWKKGPNISFMGVKGDEGDS